MDTSTGRKLSFFRMEHRDTTTTRLCRLTSSAAPRRSTLLVFFHDRDPESLPLAVKVAQWTIANMQDRTGYFYYRRYSPWLVNKTPTLHWGQATMLCALAGLYQRL